MTPEQLETVRRTAIVVQAAPDLFAQQFDAGLVERHPAAHRLFRVQGGSAALVDDVVFLVGVADDLPVFLDRARELGRRLQGYGVVAADYWALGDAFVEAVGLVVGPGWTADTADAWRRLYTLMAETMLEGAADGLFSAQG